MTTATRTKTLSAFTVRFVVEVYSDRPVEYLNGFYRGTVRGATNKWELVGPKGDQGMVIKSKILTIGPDETLQSIFDEISPDGGFYASNTRVYYDFNPEVNISWNEAPF